MSNKQPAMMSRNLAIILIIVAFFVGAGAGVFGWIMISGANTTPSADIADVAPTIDTSDSSNDAADTEETVADENESDAVEETSAQTEEMEDGEQVVFRIVPEESETRFLIDEDLRGQRITVVGATNQVGGDLLVDMTNPSASQVGTIVINARTIATDNSFRNRALNGQILKSAQDEFEFIEFVPTAVVGMPESVAVGEEVSFQIEGDLTVAGTTLPVIFEATVTLTEENRLEGSANTTVQWREFNLAIPDVPGVANISEDVGLEIDFVATAVESA